MDDFIKKISYVFGDVQYSLMLDHRKVWKCRIPRLIGEICKSIYGVDSFGSFDSRVPKRIFNLTKENKIAFILTAIIDEGSIAYDGSIQFGVSNKNMMIDFKSLCEDIGLETTSIKQINGGRHNYLYIKSLKKFNNLVDTFNKKYSLINLRDKRERLKKAIEIKNKNFIILKISQIKENL